MKYPGWLCFVPLENFLITRRWSHWGNQTDMHLYGLGKNPPPLKDSPFEFNFNLISRKVIQAGKIFIIHHLKGFIRNKKNLDNKMMVALPFILTQKNGTVNNFCL